MPEAKWVFEKILESTKKGTLKWNIMPSGRGWETRLEKSENCYYLSFVEDPFTSVANIFIWADWNWSKKNNSEKIGTISLSEADSAQLSKYITGKENPTKFLQSNDLGIHYFYRDLYRKLMTNG